MARVNGKVVAVAKAPFPEAALADLLEQLHRPNMVEAEREAGRQGDTKMRGE